MNWYSMQWTPDYMHGCSDNESNDVPQNAWGYQEAHDGEAYVSVLTYSVFENVREFIAIELYEQMQVDSIYYFSLYVSPADGGNLQTQNCFSNNLGVRFMVDPPYYWNGEMDNNPLQVGNVSHFWFEELIDDSLSWTSLSGEYVADQPYTHLVIGNFFNDESTVIEQLGEFGCEAMYYIDDVCVSRNNDQCDFTDSIEEQQVSKMPIVTYHGNYLSIVSADAFHSELKLYDLSGNMILDRSFSGSAEIDLRNISQGVYLLNLNSEEMMISTKLMKVD